MKSIKLVWLIAFTLVSFFSAQATIRPVPGQYARIQHAVDFANDGDTILIAPNTYTGPGNRDVLILNKGLTIMGDGDPSLVIIHPNDTNWYRAFAVIDPTSEVRFQNLTIEEAVSSNLDSLYDWDAGGIVSINASLTMSNCIITHVEALAVGGVVYAEGSTIQIDNCSFERCYADYGGVIYCDSGTTCIFTNTTFRSCAALSRGGVIFAEGATIELTNCSFLDNGVWIGLSGMEGYGGAIELENGSSLIVTSCRFLRNDAYSYGGAICCLRSNLEVSNSLFADNYVKCIWPEAGPPIIGDGAAIYFGGGGGTSCAINFCTIVDSRTHCGRSAVYVAASPGTISHTIIADSDTALAYSGNAQFVCSNIYGNEYGDWIGSIATQVGQNGNISEDPLFCGAFPSDYRLSASSPCAAANNSCAVTMGSEAVGCDVLCGDPNLSGAVTISDAVFLIEYIFANGEPPAVMQTGDVDCSETVNISDVVYLLNYIFSGGLNPCSACP